jgi:hypothetical protein
MEALQYFRASLPWSDEVVNDVADIVGFIDSV